MARQARKKSSSGIYHIIMRGINRQNIFEDHHDYRKFLITLQQYKKISGYQIYAYCLMANHIHLLLKVGEEPLEQFMRRICGSYVFWYNRKYQRIGNLFQDRFKSEAVEDDIYFLTVLRYIHQNPCKAGLVENIAAYKWSSFNEYTEKTLMVDTEFALDMFSADPEKAIKNFTQFSQAVNQDQCLDLEDKCLVPDEEAWELIRDICQALKTEDLQKLDKVLRNELLRQLKKDHNLSIRQIERLTGINRGIILNA